ncbi:MAG: hypothetical protein ACRET7_10625 [Burkholderiales bacterium]
MVRLRLTFALGATLLWTGLSTLLVPSSASSQELDKQLNET